MANAYPIALTAAQIGTYFVGNYYQVLQQQPEIVHQFYTDASTMLRIDGHVRESATAMLQIHTLVMSVNYTGVEIKTIHALESWNRGVLVMISGSVQQRNFTRSRKFVQTFFLAPQETGYFILNDIFHFVEEDQTHPHPAVLLAQSNYPTISASHPTPEPVPTYMMGGELQAREFAPTSDVKENGLVDNYRVPERSQPVPESESTLEANQPAESNGAAQNVVNASQDNSPTSVNDSVGEPQKHTYASILRVAKGQSAPSVAPPPVNKNSLAVSEWDHTPEPTGKQSIAPINVHEPSGAETGEEISSVDDGGEIKSVYVRNLLPAVSESEIVEEFQQFGKIRPDGVVIRGRKDLGVCYAFVEFEDMDGVYNAVKAGSAQIAGRQVYIEERRPNSNIPSRARRGRGRGSYQTEFSRGRFGGRNFSRGSGQNGVDREYNKPRGNGFYKPSSQQDRGVLGQQNSRNGQSPQE
ncbi:uncharacterized protein J3R85_016651 [Psidium guajava]|nr:uncharacterized protein J3R85_016651 [Psidium guajava]